LRASLVSMDGWTGVRFLRCVVVEIESCFSHILVDLIQRPLGLLVDIALMLIVHVRRRLLGESSKAPWLRCIFLDWLLFIWSICLLLIWDSLAIFGVKGWFCWLPVQLVIC
jgi:hypothetical protein